MNLLRCISLLMAVAALPACMAPVSHKDDPYYAPVMPMKRLTPENNSGSLFQAGYGLALYEDHLARRVGDSITVLLQEETTAKKSNSAKVKKDDKNSGSAQLGFGKYGFFDKYELTSENKRDFSGQSDAGQSNKLTGSITVTVTDVLPNGVLMVRGEKWLTLSEGDEFIRVSGMVRPEDIRPDNTVLSTRLADARVTYSGNGSLMDASKKGWVSRFVASPWWPF